jgi:putative DNA methylase
VTKTVRKKLIEVSIPLEAINIEAQRRKQKAPKGYPTSIHKYWAQRPVAACRGILFAQLVDDPSAWPDRFPTEVDCDAERRRLHKLIENLVKWEATNDEETMRQARWEIARSVAWNLGEEPPPSGAIEATLQYLQENGPQVYDPFSGSGAIPLEAQRLGLRAYGSDLNPVAVLIGRALVELPPRFAGMPPINPGAQTSISHGRWTGKGAQGVSEDVRYYGHWLRDEAARRIGNNYPDVVLHDGSTAKVIAWLWARTVPSPDPSARGARVPLVSSFILSNREGRKSWVEIVTDSSAPDGWRFQVFSGPLSSVREKELKRGTKASRGTFRCILTGAALSEDWNRQKGIEKSLGKRLMAIVAEQAGRRFYVAPNDRQEQVANSAVPPWEPEGELFAKALGFRVPAYGLQQWSDLFTNRQLLTLATVSDLVDEARQKVTCDIEALGASALVDPTEYSRAIATYLALVVDRLVFYGSTLCGWLAKDNAMAQSMPQQALPMSWDFAEGNPFGKSSSTITSCVRSVADCLDALQATNPGMIYQRDAREVEYPAGVLVSTDPPYYDNVGYADLSDFFYVWLRRSLSKAWPDLFRRLATPKSEELVATPARHGGTFGAEGFFMRGMGQALSSIRSIENAGQPVTIYYAFKQSTAGDKAIASAGWASFLQAVTDSGLVIDGTWPLRTESAGRMRGQDSNALASSIVLVCRKQVSDPVVVTRADFVRSLKRELPDAIDAIRKAGVGPVDMQQSVIGPGMGVFSRHAKVLEDDDSSMTVRTALALINRVWEEIENELDAAFDPETQVALAWYGSYGFESHSSGELIMLTTAKNTSDRALFHSGVFEDRKGKTALTPRASLPADWSPANDTHLTVWQCVQHVARTLSAEDGGTEAAAGLVAQMGSLSADARKLAYRLFEIATKKNWSAEALIYNELAEVWPKLEDRASEIASRVATPALGSPQADLFGVEV